MNVSTLEQALSDMEKGVYNLTDNGKCTQCGNCCSRLLPMTDKEIRTIKKYIKQHGIKQQVHCIPLAQPAFDLTCPFLNTGKKTGKCTIYDVRPAICKYFICSEPNGAIKHRELWIGERRTVDAVKEFFDS